MQPVKQYQKVVLKFGSNVIAKPGGIPDEGLMAHLVSQIALLRQAGVEVLLVSSGAVAAGRGMVEVKKKTGIVAQRQVFAAIGQVKLMQLYSRFFAEHGLVCAQVLVTKGDFRDRTHYLNMKNCLQALLQNQVIPIINENDVISVTELMFTDNDELAGLVATMMGADALCILSNVDGVFDGDPSQPGARLISTVQEGALSFDEFIVAKKSDFGRGGMITKCNTALKVARLGIAVHIANGTRHGVLTSLLGDNPPGTFFPPQKATSDLKKWVAHTGGYAKGRVYINEGARKALFGPKATSLLPVGVVRLEGDFKKGDVVEIRDDAGQEVGLGIARYDSPKLAEKMGNKQEQPFIHYDYLFLY